MFALNNFNAKEIPHNILLQIATYSSVIVSIILVIAKTFAWFKTESLSIQASLFDSLLDTFAALINFFAIKHALRPADEDHRFGHGKVEALASLGQSIFISLSSLWITKEAVCRLLTPEILVYDNIAIWIMLAAAFMTIALILLQRYVIKKTGSLAIRADSLHYQTDLLTTFVVLVSFYMSAQYKIYYFDTCIGALIGIYLCLSSVKIFKESFDILMDKELPKEILERITFFAHSHPQVIDMHDLKTRQSGKNYFIQMHLDVDEQLNLKEAHKIGEQVSLKVKEAYPNAEVLIHHDPIFVKKSAENL